MLLLLLMMLLLHCLTAHGGLVEGWSTGHVGESWGDRSRPRLTAQSLRVKGVDAVVGGVKAVAHLREGVVEPEAVVAVAVVVVVLLTLAVITKTSTYQRSGAVK